MEKDHPRRIWMNIVGSIPKDEEGRSYEVHHIDGDRTNNDLTNLACISLQEHYDTHYKQGDWRACQSMLRRLNLSKEEYSFKASHLATLQGKDGKLWFQSEEGRKWTADKNRKLAEEGKHYGQTDESRKRASDAAKERNARKVECPHCSKVGGYVNMKRFHFDKCKQRRI